MECGDSSPLLGTDFNPFPRMALSEPERLFIEEIRVPGNELPPGKRRQIAFGCLRFAPAAALSK
jgi:hypothetical protein